jgi:hypothetical protein
MSNIERHSKTEVEKRAKECYRLRYETTPPYTQEKWVKHCHEVYGDRSEQQYCAYWAKAKDMYEEGWKELLHKQLTPATEELIRLLADENPKVRADAVKMVYRYTGNEVIKQQIEGSLDIKKISFGDE